MSERRVNANAIRVLAMDAVQQANSGHPGMPMGMADIAEVLWRDYLVHNPKNPRWFNRDRFVLSNGHGCMLLYAALHLSGYDLSIENIKAFRQLHSITPGHPEYGLTPGVETTTGPLGQGLATAVGMAIAEKQLAASFNEPNHEIVNHFTYVFVGDGCLMEGISHEACSLAGTLGLGKLIVFYDDNGISIDGELSGWFTENVPGRFRSYGWEVIPNVDGHDPEAIQSAIDQARADLNVPTLICCKTTIGFGSPHLAGSEKTHGAPLGEDEVQATREALEWPHAPFEIPEEIYEAWDATEKGTDTELLWNHAFAKYETAYPEKAAEFLRRMNRFLPDDFVRLTEAFIQKTQADMQSVATRKASLFCINVYADMLPGLIGGSADLSGSNCTLWENATLFSDHEPTGNYIHYGVREFAMAAIMNGLALHHGVIPFGGTFLVFADYARNAIRLAALMKQKVIYVFTHDSIGLGEDGPTHQPIEHAAMLRMTPNLNVWRPCDVTETAVAWQQALQYQGPSALLLSRQTLPAQKRDDNTLGQISRGGYVLYEPSQTPTMIILATGSEVDLAVQVAKTLESENDWWVRVVSMPCCETFLEQPIAYQEAVLPKSVVQRVAIEAGAPDYWYRFVGCEGLVIGMDRFGDSAPAADLWEYFGFTVDAVKKKVISTFAIYETSE